MVVQLARAFFLALLLCWASVAAAEVAVPPLTGRVVDLTGTLSSEEIATQSQRLKDLEQRKGSQVAVLIVPTTQPETIEQYSLRVAEAWKIGRRKIDDGALLVIAKNDRKLRIEVGYGLEGALTDVTARRIIDEDIAPKFKSGDFAGGVAAGITRIIGVIDGEPLPAPAPEASHEPDLGWINSIGEFAPFIIIGPILFGAALRALFGRLLGSAATGAIVGAFAWIAVGSLTLALVLAALAFVVAMIGDSLPLAGPPGRRRGVGWSTGWSGGGGGWSSGSSSSDGGFSGGGGSFGGGGASGSW